MSDPTTNEAERLTTDIDAVYLLIHDETVPERAGGNEQLAELVILLGSAAAQLTRAREILRSYGRDMPDTLKRLIFTDQPSTNGSEPSTVMAAVALPETLAATAPNLPSVAEAEILPPQPIDAEHLIHIDPEALDSNNQKARAAYGDKARVVKILDGDALDINGQIVPLIKHQTKERDLIARKKLLTHLINSRGTSTEPRKIVEISGYTKASLAMFSMSEQLADAEGNSIVAIDYVHAKKCLYHIADDVVIEDHRSGMPTYPQVPAESKPVELAVPEAAPIPPSVLVSAESIDIAGRTFRISPEESSMITYIHSTGKAVNAMSVAQNTLEERSGSSARLDRVTDLLFILHKRGLLNEARMPDGTFGYTINLEASQAVNTKAEIRVEDHSVFVDDEDIVVMRAMGHQLKSIDQIALVLGEGEPLTEAQYDRVARVIKQYLYNYGLIEKRHMHRQPVYGLKEDASRALKNLQTFAKSRPALEYVRGEEPNGANGDAIKDPTQLRRRLVRLQNLDDINASRTSYADSRDIPLSWIDLDVGSKVTIHGKISVLRGASLAIFNHLLLNLGSPILASELRDAGVLLDEVAGATDRPRGDKEVEQRIQALTDDLNKKYGQFIYAKTRKGSVAFGIEDGFLISDKRVA